MCSSNQQLGILKRLYRGNLTEHEHVLRLIAIVTQLATEMENHYFRLIIKIQTGTYVFEDGDVVVAEEDEWVIATSNACYILNKLDYYATVVKVK